MKIGADDLLFSGNRVYQEQNDKHNGISITMKIKLHYKLFGAIFAAILVIVFYMTLVVQWSFDRGFLNYVSSVEHEQLLKIGKDLEEKFTRHASWQWLRDEPEQFARVIVDSFPDGKQKKRFQRVLQKFKDEDHFISSGPLPKDIALPFPPRVFLLDENRHVVFGFDPGGVTHDPIEIRYENSTVGFLDVHPPKHLSDSHHLIFARQQKFTLILVAVASMLIAAGLALPITFMLTRPIRKMAAATRNLASGKYHLRVKVDSADELGQLGQDLNDLATILEKNRMARSQWIADISHELRTPLSILRGKIEALQDGVYEPTDEVFKSLHREVMHLGVLVEDLYQLSLSDMGAMSYRKTEVQPCWALEQAVAMLEPEFTEKKLKLETSVDIEDGVALFADNERLKQLFTNLVSNSLRYTDSGGSIRIGVVQDGDFLIYSIEDTAPGVSEEHLGKLFDRLYRVDVSRSRDLGGAGLGLSICANIVKGHNGTINATHSVLGGLKIVVRLPLLDS